MSKKEQKSMWKHYDVTWRFTGRLCGSVPLAKELVRPWLEARKPSNAAFSRIVAEAGAENVKSIEALAEEVEATLPDDEELVEGIEERITLGFQSDEHGLYVRAGSIKAHLKDAANQLRGFLGISAFKSKVANRLFITQRPPHSAADSQAIHLLVQTIDGRVLPIRTDNTLEMERPVHVQTALGPRNALKRIRYVTDATLRFRLKVLNDGLLTESHIDAILEYGSIHGFGGERSLGDGQYEYELTPVEIDEPSKA